MTLKKLSLAALAEIDDGRLREAIEQAIRACEADCRDRPADDADRTITLSIMFEPVVASNGDLDSVNTRFAIATRLPKKATRAFNMSAGRGPGLFFNDLAPDNARQATLDDAPAKGKAVGHAP